MTLAVAGITAASFATVATTASGATDNRPVDAAVGAYKAAFAQLSDGRARAVAAVAGSAKHIADPGQRIHEDTCTSRLVCNTTLRSGSIAWASTSNNPVCSLGFTARSPGNTRYVFTADHYSKNAGGGH